MVSRLLRLAGQSRDQVRGEFGIAPWVGSPREPDQVDGAALIDGDERVEDRRHQKAAARMGLSGGRECPARGRIAARRPRIVAQQRQGVAQRTQSALRAPELLGQPGQQSGCAQRSPARRQLVADHRGHSEMLEQRDDVRKAFVESQRVDRRRLDRATLHPVQDRVGRLVRDDILRQTGEHPMRIDGPRAHWRWAKIAEQQRPLLRAVIGIRLAQCVWIDAELAREAAFDRVGGRAPLGVGRPQHETSQRPLERADRPHCHRKDHLLMKLRTSLGRRQTILRQQQRMVQIDRRIEDARCRIEVDDLQIVVHRAGSDRRLPSRLPRQFHHRIVDDSGRQFHRSLRIESVNFQPALGRHRICVDAYRFVSHDTPPPT
ncbi:hypothetical protein [Sphingomonas sp. NPDC079357]|uniref:hypothetical protein n=1 Tax=Sphingomonas sp. NPDC079357 TaxID=3364518 RepID=UPI00384C9218